MEDHDRLEQQYREIGDRQRRAAALVEVPGFDRWVLTELVDRGFAASEGALVAQIVRQWIEQNEARHQALGVTREAFLAGSRGGSA